MQKIRKSVLIFIFLLALYALLRLIFYQLYFNTNNLPSKQLLQIVYWGFRIDIATIFYSNLIFFLYFFLLHDLLPGKRFFFIALVLLSVINLPLLAINIIDLAYYKFNLRRSTVDLFRVMFDSLSAVGAFFKTWWYLFVLFIFLSVVSVIIFNLILTKRINATKKGPYLQSNLIPLFLFILPVALAARGFSGRPVMPSTSLLYVPAQYQPLVNNSSFTLLYSILKRQTKLKEKNYYTQAQLDSLFTARQQFHTATPFNKMNVVVFILESFAKEYTDKTNLLHAQMPFLDSIMAQSMVCTNARSNATESNKGLVAILGGIPAFFDEPFYYSGYSSNNIRGIGALLKEEGYNTSFFMGAGYDHFGFAKFSKMMGIDNYYSMDDYGNKKHYDGNWGIYDHYFLPYAAKELTKKKTPFFSTVFTISTHFPYKLPDSLKDKFTLGGQGAAQNSMSYLDYSLRLFFDAIKNEEWYKNTIFVFSADHNIFWYVNEKATVYKRFRIPIFFHVPGKNIQQQINTPVQQLDIIPTLLDMLHYNHPFMSFGKSVFDTSFPGIAVNRIDDIYQAIDSAYLYGYNEKAEQSAYLYNFQLDPALKKNLLVNGHLPDQHSIKLQQHLKAVIQYFNNSMIENKLYIK